MSMMRAITTGIIFFVPHGAMGQVFSYEADVSPVEGGWTFIQATCGAEDQVEDGWLVHELDLCSPPPGGQQLDYTRSLSEFTGLTFFAEWRMVTDGPSSEFPSSAPAVLSVWSQCGVEYIFVISADKVKLNRDNLLPILILDIHPGVTHTYRLELYGADLYIWSIDGQIADSGVPEGTYPCLNPAINFRSKAKNFPNTTKWDYIRYGVIPQPNSGDYDSDGNVDHDDLYFFIDCLLGPPYDAAGPGCTWADMNADGTTDGQDIQLFVDAMIGG